LHNGDIKLFIDIANPSFIASPEQTAQPLICLSPIDEVFHLFVLMVMTLRDISRLPSLLPMPTQKQQTFKFSRQKSKLNFGFE
jgi:hypothetical protein